MSHLCIVATLVAVLVTFCQVSLVKPDEETCVGCTDYREDEENVDVAVTAEGTVEAPTNGEYLPASTMAELTSLRPEVQRIATMCYRDSEELCSLLVVVEKLFNESLVSKAEREIDSSHIDKNSPQVLFTRVGAAITDLMASNHVAAHATLQELKAVVAPVPTTITTNASTSGNESEPLVELPLEYHLVALATEVVTSYAGGDKAAAERLVRQGLEVGKLLHSELQLQEHEQEQDKQKQKQKGVETPRNRNAPNRHRQKTKTGALVRDLVATLYLAQSKLRVDDGAWSNGTLSATEV